MRDDALRELLAACAKCGTCRTVCTLYPERKSEIAVARGKIAVLDAALSGRDDDAPAVQEALADCLLCGRCERGCPNQVPFEEIAMKGRADLAARAGIPAWKRVVFGKVMPSPGSRRAAAAAAAVAQRVFLSRVPTSSGLHYRFPEKFGLSGRTLPEVPAKSFTAGPGTGEGDAGDATLFVGCVFDHLFPEVGRAAFETMRASGKRISVFRDAPCCGLPAMVSGDRAAALACVEENVRRLDRDGAGHGPIVFPCGSCLLMFRRNALLLLGEAHPLRDAAGRVAGRSVDYASFMLESGAVERLPGLAAHEGSGTVGYHDPCHLTGTLGKGPEARQLLERVVGPAFAEMKGAEACCGYGGTFNIRDYGTSSRIGERKILAAASGGTRVVATACSGCLLQLRDAAARSASGVRLLHVAELVRKALFVR